jgi:methyltransferase-like protein
MGELIGKIGASNQLATEQYIDIVSGRAFRQTLLVGGERSTRIDRGLSGARVEGLHFIGATGIKLTQESNGVTLAAPSGRRLHTASPLLAEVLARFVAAFPASSNVDDLMAALPASARNAQGSEQGRAQVREGLLNMTVNGLAVPRLDPVTAAARATNKPVACPLERREAALGAATAVNLRHERVDLAGLAQFVLPLLDGSRDADAVGAAIADAGGDGRLAFSRNGVAIGDTAERQKIAANTLRTLLPELARAALLVA